MRKQPGSSLLALFCFVASPFQESLERFMASHQSGASPPRAAWGRDTRTAALASPASLLCSCPPAPPPWCVLHPVPRRGWPAPAHPSPGANTGCREQGWGCTGAHPPPAPRQCCRGLHSLTPGRGHHLSSGSYRKEAPDAPFCGLFGNGAEAPRGGKSRGSCRDRAPSPPPA